MMGRSDTSENFGLAGAEKIEQTKVVGRSDRSPHDCLDSSGVIVCGHTEPHHDYPWMDRPVTQAEIDAVPDGRDLRECRVCHRRFTKACNFDLDFA